MPAEPMPAEPMPAEPVAPPPTASDAAPPPPRTPAPATTPPREGAYAFALFALVMVVVAISTGRNHIRGDASEMCAAASSIPDHGWIDLGAQGRRDAQTAPDGLRYSKYSIVAILQCGAGSALRGAGKLIGGDGSAAQHLFAGIYPAFEAGLCALGMFFVARRLRFSRGIAATAAVLLIFSTPLWSYAREMYSEVTQACVVIWSLWAYLKAFETGRRRDFLLGGALVGLAVIAKTPLAVIGLATFVYFLMLRPDRTRVVRFLVWGAVGFLPFLALYLGYNVLRYGELADRGYSQLRDGTLGFSTPLAVGLHMLLLSPGKSIFVYAPVLLLAPFGAARMWRANRPALVFALIPAVFTYLIIAKWWAGHGDWGWGPRLVVHVTPLLFVPLLYVMRRGGAWRAALITLGALGIVINVLGNVVDHSHYLGVVGVTHAGMRLDPASLFIRDDLVIVHCLPEMSPPVGHYWLLERFVTGEPWAPSSWYPWDGLGIPGWRPVRDPTPLTLNMWSDGSAWAWTVIGVGYALAGFLLTMLWAGAVSERRWRAGRPRASA